MHLSVPLYRPAVYLLVALGLAAALPQGGQAQFFKGSITVSFRNENHPSKLGEEVIFTFADSIVAAEPEQAFHRQAYVAGKARQASRQYWYFRHKSAEAYLALPDYEVYLVDPWFYHGKPNPIHYQNVKAVKEGTDEIAGQLCDRYKVSFTLYDPDYLFSKKNYLVRKQKVEGYMWFAPKVNVVRWLYNTYTEPFKELLPFTARYGFPFKAEMEFIGPKGKTGTAIRYEVRDVSPHMDVRLLDNPRGLFKFGDPAVYVE